MMRAKIEIFRSPNKNLATLNRNSKNETLKFFFFRKFLERIIVLLNINISRSINVSLEEYFNVLITLNSFSKNHQHQNVSATIPKTRARYIERYHRLASPSSNTSDR